MPRVLPRQLNCLRMACLMINLGFFISGPLGHLLYLNLERMLAGRSGKSAALLKLLGANFVISPILIGLYLVALARISGLPLKKSITVARNRLLATLKISWIINPLVQIYAFQVSAS